MGFYDDKVVPALLDLTMQQKPFKKQRGKVVPKAEGRVLEIGMGSGLNLAYYDKGRLEKLYGLEPHEEFVGLYGEEIPMDDAAVDDIVITYTLCTIPGVKTALQEMKRVLKPGGRMHFSEHGLAPDPKVQRWQNRLNVFWNALAGGCNMNRRIDELIDEAGFVDVELDTMYLPGPRILTFNYWGIAHAPK
jgi:SAM-dependent methyltransferase